MVYSLNDNVYFVKGTVNGCIYDFNNAKLYHINNMLATKIESLNEGTLSSKVIDSELKQILDKFVNIGIVKLSDHSEKHYIEEISKKVYQFDFAWIELTNKCNLKCRHCYNESSSRCENIMSLSDYKIVVDNLIKLGVHSIQIIGGEPFLYPKLLRDMLEYAKGKFDDIEIFTNGTLVTEDWLKYLTENCIRMALSVYSYDKKIHDAVTACDGSWNRTNKTIAALKKCGITYRVCNILMNGVHIGEKNTDLYTLNENRDIVRLSGRADFSLLNDELIKKKLITKDKFRYPINRELCASWVSGHNCFMKKIYISAKLEVFPCSMERRLKHCMANIHDGIVIDERICNLNKDKINVCKHCEYRYACFDCRANSVNQDVLGKPWYCTYNPHTGIWENVDKFIGELKKQNK